MEGSHPFRLWPPHAIPIRVRPAREILLEDITLETDEVVRRARNKGADQPDSAL